jgi:hypothetical protein
MQRQETKSQKIESLVRQNIKLAKSLWSGELDPFNLSALKKLTRESRLALAAGEILWLNGGWYVTSGGLLRIAKENHCHGIRAHAMSKLSDATNNRWVFKATVYKSRNSKGFVGYGDADPSNVSLMFRGAELRIAETRAVNRALRKAYGIGFCSVEELGARSGSSGPARNHELPMNSHSPNGSDNGQPRLRDRLCLLIRQYGLDPALVKAYAADFCGTPSLKEAKRDLVESFISHLAVAAKEDRDGLLCKLNSYAQPVEVKL